MSFKLSIVASYLLALGSPVPNDCAFAHAYPAIVSPANGVFLTESPREVRMQFTEAIELAFSRITVKRSKGEIVSQGKLRQLANDTLAVDILPLISGIYSVEWQVLSVDTHITDGALRFTVTMPVK